MAGLNMAIIKRLPVVVPPIELQREFASRLEQLTASVDIMQAHSMDLDTLVVSMQQRAFSGEL